ncbi:hypothetical protein A3Q56_02387 [Intoshia linei]|uniref:K Homology domain-containing protein n=1 Tax=Intoshia linei TaxID=1819745 RepID=A0A177B6H1_9BILA|nr:hypothetical protein A3Q56_02387 [Intoshia linei]
MVGLSVYGMMYAIEYLTWTNKAKKIKYNQQYTHHLQNKIVTELSPLNIFIPNQFYQDCRAYRTWFINKANLSIAHKLTLNDKLKDTISKWKCAEEMSKIHIMKNKIEKSNMECLSNVKKNLRTSPINTKGKRKNDDKNDENHQYDQDVVFEKNAFENICNGSFENGNLKLPFDIENSEYLEKGTELLFQAVETGCVALVNSLINLKVPVNVKLEDRCLLVEAVCRGFHNIVEFLLKAGADVNILTKRSRTVMHLAVIDNDEKMVRILLRYCVLIDKPDGDGHTPLMKAVLNKNFELMQLLIQNGAKVVSTGDFKETPLSIAAYKGYTDVVKFLLMYIKDCKCLEYELYSALMETSMDGHIEVAKLLLEAGSPVNVIIDGFESPLMLAICSGNNKYVSILLDHGAFIDEINEDGNTPLMEACREGNEYVVSLLLSRGADTGIQAANIGETALTIAASSGYLDIVRLLVAIGAEIDQCTNDYTTALMEACQMDHVGIGRFLLEKGANVNAKTNTQRCALHMSADGGSGELIQLLINYNANLEDFDEFGTNPLIIAANCGNLIVVKLLVKNGVNVNSCEMDGGMTALMAAVISGYENVVEYLISEGADTSVKINDNRTLLIEAVKNNHLNIVKFLLNLDVKKNNQPHYLNKSGEMCCGWENESNQNSENGLIVENKEDSNNETEFLVDDCDELVNANKAFMGRVPLVYRLAELSSESTDPSKFDELIFKVIKQIEGNGDLFGVHKNKRNKFLEEIKRIKASHAQKLQEKNDLAIEFSGELERQDTLSGTDIENIKNEAMYQLISSEFSQFLEEFDSFQLNSNDPESENLEKILSDENSHLFNNVVNNDSRNSTSPFCNICYQHQKLHRLQQQIHLQLKQPNVLEIQQEQVEKQLNLIREKRIHVQKQFGLIQERQCMSCSEKPQLKQDDEPFFCEEVLRDKDDRLVKIQIAWKKQLQLIKIVQNNHEMKKLQLVSEAQVIRNKLKCQQRYIHSKKLSQNSCNQNETCNHTCVNKLGFNNCAQQYIPFISNLPHIPEIKQNDVSFIKHCKKCYNVIAHPMVEINAETKSTHDTALTIAATAGNVDLVSMLLKCDANIEHHDKKGFTPLILSTAACSIPVIELLLDAGANINAYCEKSRDTALSLACSSVKNEKNRSKLVKLILDRGADIEHRNVSDYTPLCLAASDGHLDVIKILLSSGAEINARTGSKLGISPLMLASMNGHVEAVEYFLSKGADIHAQIETNKNTALTLACFQGRADVVALLLKAKPNVEHRSKSGLTPLMEAASGGYVDVCKLLVESNADVNAMPVNSSRDTALTIACEKGHTKFVDVLIQNHAYLDVKNKKGNCPLYLACMGGFFEIVKMLLNAGADPDSNDNRKVYCISVALRKGFVNIVRYLVKFVTQFPSDINHNRFMSNIDNYDEDQLRRCFTCLEVVKAAKHQQETQANRNAFQLLMEEANEKHREEIKRGALARKREKRKNRKNKIKAKSQKDKLEPIKSEPVESDEEVPKIKSKCSVEEETQPINEKDVQLQNNWFIKNSNKSNDSETNIKFDTSNNSNYKEVALCSDKKSISKKESDNIANSTEIEFETYLNGNNRNFSSNISLTQVYTNGNDKNKKIPQVKLSNNCDTLPIEKMSHSNTSFTTNCLVEDSHGTVSDFSTDNLISDRYMVKNSNLKLPSLSQNDCINTSDINDRYFTNITEYQSNLTALKSVKNINIPIMSTTGISSSTKSTTESLTSPQCNRNSKHYRKSEMEHMFDKKINMSNRTNIVSTRKTVRREVPENWKEVVPRRPGSTISKKVVVPAGAISRVIGRGGCNINAIRESSAAHIDVDKHRGPVDRVITIKGMPESVRYAERLIRALVEDADVDLDKLIFNAKCDNYQQLQFNASNIYQNQPHASHHISSQPNTRSSNQSNSANGSDSRSFKYYNYPNTTGVQNSRILQNCIGSKDADVPQCNSQEEETIRVTDYVYQNGNSTNLNLNQSEENPKNPAMLQSRNMTSNHLYDNHSIRYDAVDYDTESIPTPSRTQTNFVKSNYNYSRNESDYSYRYNDSYRNMPRSAAPNIMCNRNSINIPLVNPEIGKNENFAHHSNVYICPDNVKRPLMYQIDSQHYNGTDSLSLGACSANINANSIVNRPKSSSSLKEYSLNQFQKEQYPYFSSNSNPIENSNEDKVYESNDNDLNNVFSRMKVDCSGANQIPNNMNIFTDFNNYSTHQIGEFNGSSYIPTPIGSNVIRINSDQISSDRRVTPVGNKSNFEVSPTNFESKEPSGYDQYRNDSVQNNIWGNGNFSFHEASSPPPRSEFWHSKQYQTKKFDSNSTNQPSYMNNTDGQEKFSANNQNMYFNVNNFQNVKFSQNESETLFPIQINNNVTNSPINDKNIWNWSNWKNDNENDPTN